MLFVQRFFGFWKIMMLTLSHLSPMRLTPASSKSSNLSRKKTQSTNKNPNFEPFKDRLIRLSNMGQVREAISVLEFMNQEEFTGDVTIFTVLLKSCIRTRNLDLGKLVHSKLNEYRFELNCVLVNSLISLYSKCGDWATAEAIFDSMGENGMRDLVSWSAMISCFAHNRMESRALLTFIEMLRHGEYPNQFCFSAVILACCNEDNACVGEAVFGFVIKTGYFGLDVCLGCALIDLYTKGFGDLESAKKVFDRMPEKNSITWALLITRFAQLGQPDGGIHLFLDMLWSGFTHNRFTLSSVVSACAERGYLSLGRQLHSLIIKSSLCLDVCIGCCLIDLYAKCAADGCAKDARKVFDRLPNHNVLSWTAIITGYVQSGGLDRVAIELYCKMITEGRVLPNHLTFSSLLKACGSLSDMEMGKQIHNQAVKAGLVSVNRVGNSLISMYARSGSMEDAQKAFQVFLETNLTSYNAIVDGFEETRIVVDEFTFASLLSAAASLGTVGKGEEIHARLVKSGFESNQRVCNALISMYSRCGDIEAATQVFSKMKDQNVVSWTSMITGFAKHGLARKALAMFDEMLEVGIKPNGVTYIAVLSACSHVGMVSEGMEHFNTMSHEHRISPRMEHYVCVVDLLGRSGSLERALDFIKSMPFKADVLVWRTLLGACKVHGDTELGKLASKMITEQDPDDPTAYILLSNLCASKGQWEEVANIRKIMKEQNLVKEAGCSWIETRNQVHKFYVGDTRHPRASDIYNELGQLISEMKEKGYVPDTEFVLHELNVEEKERYVIQHSEKLAVAYGLLRTSRKKPIRVFKNLRICGDCHTAMKYISIVRGREIVVRDSNRFHHFKDGFCSCKDYW